MRYPLIIGRVIRQPNSLGHQFVVRNYSSCGSRISLPATSATFPVFSGHRSLRNGQQPLTLLTLARYESTSIPEVRLEDGVLGALDGAFGAPHVHSTIGDMTSTVTTASVTEETPVLPPEATLQIGDIPEPPEIASIVESVNKLVLNSAGEPTFESLGLGGWWPPGIVQQCLEFLHINMGLPWWGAILTGTIVVRLLVFPLVIASQKNAAKMRNHLPEMQVIQLKMSEARQSGDQYMVAKYSQDLMHFMKEKQVNPFKSMLVPLAMAPVFISCFFGLRKMANLPVESLREGGLFWFTDLSVCDPYYILPLITSTTLLITLEIGADGVRVDSGPNSQIIKYAMRILPLIVFPLTMHFPAAMLCYWVSTNSVSLIQVSFLKIPAIREKFGIEAVKKFKPVDLPIKQKGFTASMKDSWSNLKISHQMQERERYDEMSFKRAGRGPLPKTFKYDPTKIQAKSK